MLDQIKEALEAAKQKGKHYLFIAFSTTWCHWCKVLHKFLGDSEVKAILCTDMDILELDVDKLDEAELSTLSSFKAGKEMNGVPWFAVAQVPSGDLVFNSYVEEVGGNMGCPSTDNEIRLFLSLLETHLKLSSDQLLIIQSKLKSK